MAFRALTPESRYLPAGRVLEWGPPNSFKTTAIVEYWPEEEGVVGSKQFISLPGEKGYESIPHRKEIISHVWGVDDVGSVSPHSVLREANQILAQVTANKPTTLAVEGIHKYYDFAYQAAFDDLISGGMDEEKASGPAYGKAHKTTLQFINRLSATGVPYIVLTCWEGEEKDDPKDKSRNATKHRAPMLPGKLATWITGEFGVSVRSFIKRTPTALVGLWQITPDPQAPGCAVKTAKEVATQLPRTIPQDFRVLRDLVAGEPLAKVRELYGYAGKQEGTK